MTTQVQKTDDSAVKGGALTPSERFTNEVIRQFTANNGGLKLTSFQNKLIQSYFIKLDSILKDNEHKRKSKSEQYQEPLAYDWKNVNMAKLTQDVVPWAAIGLDPLQKNHINMVCMHNKNTEKYDIAFIIGYRGAELKARKYGYDVPNNVVVEVVFKNDKFRPFKKDRNNDFESYEFQVAENAFDRGEVVGGFYFHEYVDEPYKNFVAIFDRAAIDKRKPKKASAEFWGGTKTVKKWVLDPNTNKKVQVEETEEVAGWYEEMVYKTLHLAAYADITIDSEKIDDHLVKILQMEQEGRDANDATVETVPDKIKREVKQKANKSDFKFEEAEIINEDKDPSDEEVETPEENTEEVIDADPPKIDEGEKTSGNPSADAGIQPSFSFDN